MDNLVHNINCEHVEDDEACVELTKGVLLLETVKKFNIRKWSSRMGIRMNI